MLAGCRPECKNGGRSDRDWWSVRSKAKRRGGGKTVGAVIAALVGACALSAPALADGDPPADTQAVVVTEPAAADPGAQASDPTSTRSEPGADTGSTGASGEAGSVDLPASEGDSPGASGSTEPPPPVDDPVPPPVSDPPPAEEPTPPPLDGGTTQAPGDGEPTPGPIDPPPTVDPPVTDPPGSSPPPTLPPTPGSDVVPDAPTVGHPGSVPVVVSSGAPKEALPTIGTLALGQSGGGDRVGDAPSSRRAGRGSEGGRPGEATAPKSFTLGASSVGGSAGSASAAGGGGGGASSAIGLALLLCVGLQCLGRLLRLPPEAARSLTLVLSLERPG